MERSLKKQKQNNFILFLKEQKQNKHTHKKPHKKELHKVLWRKEKKSLIIKKGGRRPKAKSLERTEKMNHTKC